MIRKMAFVAGNFDELPPHTQEIVNDAYAKQVKKKLYKMLKATRKKLGRTPKTKQLRRLNPKTAKIVEEEYTKLKYSRTYIVNSKNKTFEGGFRQEGYDKDNLWEGLKQLKYVNAQNWLDNELPPPSPEEEIVIPPSVLENIINRIKEIGHPMKYPERRASWEKALTDILEHTKNNVSNLTQEDLKMAEKFKEIMSVDYKEYTYTDPVTRGVRQGRSSKTTGAKGRHMDEIDSIIQYIRENMGNEELKSWQKTLKASQSLADYISRILEEMGYDANQIKVS